MISLLVSLFCILPNKYEITCESRSIEIEPQQIESQDYLPLKPIAEVLNINYVLDHTTQRLYLSGNGHKIVLIPGVSTIMHDNFYQNIPFSTHLISGDVYFPAVAVITTIGGAFEKLVFIKEIKEVPPIHKISIMTRADSTVLKFSWDKSLDFDVQFYPGRAVVEIDGKYTTKSQVKPIGAITSAEITPFKTYTKLELAMKDVNSVLERNDEVVFYYKITKQVKLIVIDPGHGGIDPGAIGKKGLYEKDVNLDLAKMLRDFIEDSLGIRVVLTREKDAYLSLKARTNIANLNGADIFVSIHCNASAQSSRERGFETYFLSEARTDAARAVEARENASLKFDGIEPSDDIISFILHDLAQSEYLQESNRLAEFVQTSAENVLDIPARRVNQAGFYVLRGAFMPAILIESAFISNREEEQLLRNKSFKKRLAYCMFQGLKDFIADYQRRLNN
ncbi:MAG: N-acetylmuramoyl-L-alanine amidase [candidate division WOR-3 bacterium]|nr:MAG: N-acetylmuramoyl-L-alanine amidase [candidate division WOR-3 bacterium]